MNMRFFISALALSFGLNATAEEVSFQRDVWPVFKRHCIGCHSEKKAKGDLRMDDVAALLKGGKTGHLFNPGKPEDSLLISQISGDKPEMPENEPPLSSVKIKLLRDWVAQGAKIDGPPKFDLPKLVIPSVYESAPAVTSVSMSPDGHLCAAACRSEVIVFNVDSDEAPRRLPTEFDLVTHVEFSPDGTRLAVAGGSPQRFGGLIFFNAIDGHKESERRFGKETFFKGNFAPDGKSIALGGANGAVYIFETLGDSAPKVMDLHSDWVTAVVYTPDGKRLVSGSRDKTTKVSSVEALSLLRSVDESPEMINAVAADKLTAISGGNARVLAGYDFNLALGGIELSGAGNGARPVNNRNQYLRVFEAQPDAVMSLATSADGKLLAVATRAPEVRIYQTDTRVKKVTLTKVPSPVLSVSLNKDGTRLVLGSKTGAVQVWDVKSAILVKTVKPVPVVGDSLSSER